MKKSIVFATNNQHKAQEVNQMLPEFDVQSLKDINFNEEIEETGLSFKENAEIKAKAIFNSMNMNVFADDSGLVIPALNGEPGIYSARYAGTGDSKDNIQKVLSNLEGIKDREAYFISVICLIFEGETYFFEGRVYGTILNEISGENGFGYDPIFLPKGYDKSFAEFTEKEKNEISHRGLAIKKMYDFIKQKIQ